VPLEVKFFEKFLHKSPSLITTGIGRAIAESLGSKGAHLILGYTSPGSAAQTEELSTTLQKDFSIKTMIVQADMADPQGPAALVAAAKSQFTNPETGKFQIDIIINNAGVSVNRPVEEVTIDDFNNQYNINVLGPLLLLQAALPYLPHDRSGRIVSLSSVSSTMGFMSQTVYGGTKAALEAMTRTWSRELAERCTVNCVNPGPVKTDMWDGTTSEFRGTLKPYISSTPLSAVREGIDEPALIAGADIAGGRPAYSEEVAGVVAMLCTVDAGWVTGQCVCGNGGMRMSI
jgi:3-oxoacyl-[acyl-carrier protein] reductase